MQNELRVQAEYAAEKAAEKAEKEAWRAANPEEAAAEDAEIRENVLRYYHENPNSGEIYKDDPICSGAYKEVQDWRAANPEAAAAKDVETRAKRIADLVENYIEYPDEEPDPENAEEVEAK